MNFLKKGDKKINWADEDSDDEDDRVKHSSADGPEVRIPTPPQLVCIS